MKRLVTLGVVIFALASVGVASANEAPMAEAGLDQDAELNTTVYLHAGGSLDPDGDIEQWEWSIETPTGNHTTPNCRSCIQTWFVPNKTGLYNVTIQVVDDDGATRNDTLFVVVGELAPSGVTTSSTSTESDDTSGGVGTGSVGGSSTSSPSPLARIIQTESGLQIAGGLNQAEYRIAAGGGTISIPGNIYQDYQVGPGTVPLSAVEGELRAHGYDMEDARNSIDPDTCGTTRGSGCADRIGSRPTGSEDLEVDLDDVSPDYDDSDDDENGWEDDDDNGWEDEADTEPEAPDESEYNPIGGQADGYRDPVDNSDPVQEAEPDDGGLQPSDSPVPPFGGVSGGNPFVPY